MKKSNGKTTGAALSYTDSLHNTGRVFTMLILLVICLVPVAYCISAGVVPLWGAIAKAIPFILGYVMIGLIEAISYAPLLGVGGQYLAFITGNISNLKLPCSLNAQTAAKTKQGSEEQEVISSIAIAVSSITTTLIIVIGLIPLAIFGQDIVMAIEPIRHYVIPAIFGGLGLVLLSRYFKLTIIPFGIMLIVCLVTFLIKTDIGQSTALTIGMAVSILSGFLMYRRDKQKFGPFVTTTRPRDSAGKKELPPEEPAAQTEPTENK